MQDLAGKTAFVTGGASGIGFALARACMQAVEYLLVTRSACRR